MQIIKVKNAAEGANKSFEIYQNALANGVKVLGLATGASPIALYDKLATSDLDFSDVVSVNLDEYLGLDGNDPQSYRYFMNEHCLTKKISNKLMYQMGNKQIVIKRYMTMIKSFLNTQLTCSC